MPRGWAAVALSGVRSEEAWYFDLVGVTVCSKDIYEEEPNKSHSIYLKKKKIVMSFLYSLI